MYVSVKDYSLLLKVPNPVLYEFLWWFPNFTMLESSLAFLDASKEMLYLIKTVPLIRQYCLYSALPWLDLQVVVQKLLAYPAHMKEYMCYFKTIAEPFNR